MSTRDFLKGDIQKIWRNVQRLQGSLQLNYFGCCFGRYDIAVEFDHVNPRVLSSLVWRLHEQLKEAGLAENNFCPSLTLCKKICGESHAFSHPIRVYTFINTKHEKTNEFLSIACEYVQEKSKQITSIELFWNTSTYSFMLTIQGERFYDIYQVLLEFKETSESAINEISTLFTLRWDPKKVDFQKDLVFQREECTKEILAIVYVKLKNSKKSQVLNLPDGFVTLFDIAHQFENPGYYDMCLGIKKPTLAEIKEAVYELRNYNKNCIESTSTILLFPRGGTNEGLP